MATYEELMDAARRADAAGDADGARRFLEIAATQRGSGATQSPSQPQQERGFLHALGDNIIGYDDGVTSPGEWLGSWLNRGGESMTLGLAGDELNAATYGMLPGRSYEGELERFRQNEENLGGLGRFSADIAGGVIPALAGVGVASSAPTLMGAVGRGAALGAGAGATQGFMEGEGGLPNRLASGTVGGVLGGSMGAAIPAAGAVARHVGRGIDTARRGANIGQQIGADLGISPEAGRVMGRIVGENDQAAMQAAMNRAGHGAMLADASDNLASNLDATMRNPGPGSQIARQRVDARAGQASDTIMDALVGGQQGPRMPPVAQQRAMGAAGRAQVHPLYQRAYNTPIDYATPGGAGAEIMELIERIPPRTASQAIQRATDRMIYDGVPNAQILAQIGDDGAVKLSQLPNVMQLDYIKRAFDEIAEDGKDAITGRLSSDGAFASRIARDLREATKRAVPEYGEALSAAASDIRQRSAVQTGQRLLRPQTTVEEVAEAISDATPAELRAMRDGVLGQFEHALGNVRAVASDPNIDARQASQAFRDLSSPNARQKMQALFGDEWPQLSRALDETESAVGLRARVAGNSATQPRQAAVAAIAEDLSPGPVRSLQPIGSARELGQRALGSDPASVARLNQEVQAEIAELLTRQGPEASQALSAVVRALSQNPANPAVGNAIRNNVMISGGAAIPAVNQSILDALLPAQRGLR